MDSVPDFKDVFLALKKLCFNALYLKKNEEGEVVIRSDMREISDVERFVDLYQTLTHSEFNVFKNKHLTRYVYRKQWFCHFQGRTKPPLDYRCRASINVLIKRLTRYTLRKDPLLRLKPPLCTIIKISYPHSHPVLEKKCLRKNKMTNEVKKIFYEYFKHGIGVMNAKKLHLKLLRETKFPYMDDRCMNPALNTIYRLHRFYLQNVAPKDNTQADPALEKGDSSLKLENIKKEDLCHDDFVNHIKETIVRLTTFPKEPSVDIPDTKSIKTDVVGHLAFKDNFSTKNDCAENNDTAQQFMCISNVLRNTELGNVKDEKRLSRLNHTMNQYQPIMPKPMAGGTNSKIVIPANSRSVSATVNPIILRSTDVLRQTPILFSKYGPLKIKAIMIQNIKS